MVAPERTPGTGTRGASGCSLRCTSLAGALDVLRTPSCTRTGAQQRCGTHEDRTLSFRSRLLLFFMIIVIVPMIAVALVLFSITADSETGKADAQIAQGLRASFAIYDADRSGARAVLARVSRDPQLVGALERHDRGAAQARLRALIRALPSARRIAVYDPARRLLAAAGRADAV